MMQIRGRTLLLRALIVWAFQIGLAQPVAAQVALDYLQTTADLTDASVYAYDDLNLGTESADRCIDVVTGSRRAGPTAAVSSITLDGNTVDILAQEDFASGGIVNLISVASIAYPTGATGDLVVTYADSMSRSIVALLARTGSNGCASPFDSDSSSLADPTVALDIPENGGGIGACMKGSNTTTTWTGLTEDYDAFHEATVMFTGASAVFATAQTGLTVTCDFATGEVFDEIGLFVSFAPAGVATGPPIGSFQLLGVGR